MQTLLFVLLKNILSICLCSLKGKGREIDRKEWARERDEFNEIYRLFHFLSVHCSELLAGQRQKPRSQSTPPMWVTSSHLAITSCLSEGALMDNYNLECQIWNPGIRTWDVCTPSSNLTVSTKPKLRIC